MSIVSALLALWLAPLGQQTSPALRTYEPNQVADIILRNTRVRPDTVLHYVQTKVGDVLNEAVIARDVKALNEPGFFDDIRVLTQDGPRGGKIVIFEFKDRRTVRRIEYPGLKSLTESDLITKMKEQRVQISPETRLDVTKIKKAEVMIKSILGEKGRFKATVEATYDDIPPNAVIVRFNIVEGPKLRIEKVEIEGNTVFTDAQLKHVMKWTKETGPITVFTGKDTYYDLKLADDVTHIRQLYSENGYVLANALDPIVEVRPKRVYRTLPFIKTPFPYGIPIPFWKKTVDRFFITLKIEENEQFRVGDVKITGNKTIKEEYIRPALGLIPGEIYNESRLRKGFDGLKELYGAIGFINYSPDTEHDLDQEKKLVNVTLNINEDKMYFVNRIAFSGNTTTRDKVIRRELRVDEGERFSSALWKQSVARLNQLGYFDEIKEADSDIHLHTAEPKVDLGLKITEKAKNTIGLSGGMSAVGGSFIGINYSTNNFLGFGETLAIDIDGGSRQSNFVLSFTEPYFLDRPLALGFSLFARNYKYDQAREVLGLDPESLPAGLGLENRLNFEQKRSGFSFSGSYPLRSRSLKRIGITYQWDNSVSAELNPATKEYFSAVTTQERQNFVTAGGSFGTYRARKIIPSFNWSTVNNPYYSTNGQSVTATFEYTGGFLGGNVNYVRPTVEYRYYRPHTRHGNVIALRLLASTIRGFSGVNEPFYERFFLGGDYDIRGFETRALSPISFITRNLPTVDPETGATVSRPFDDIVYVGGDTQGILNIEYRIPIVGTTVTLAPFFDVGNSWVTAKHHLERELLEEDGTFRKEGVQLLPGTNSGLRMSTGVELTVVLPVISAPFRLIFAYNPLRTSSGFIGPATGSAFLIDEPKKKFKFTIGKTF